MGGSRGSQVSGILAPGLNIVRSSDMAIRYPSTLYQLLRPQATRSRATPLSEGQSTPTESILYALNQLLNRKALLAQCCTVKAKETLGKQIKTPLVMHVRQGTKYQQESVGLGVVCYSLYENDRMRLTTTLVQPPSRRRPFRLQSRQHMTYPWLRFSSVHWITNLRNKHCCPSNQRHQKA